MSDQMRMPDQTDESTPVGSTPVGSTPVGSTPGGTTRVGPYCTGCVHTLLECAGCGRTLDPPRFCPQCGRRMAVQVIPTGWVARCRDHAELRSP